MEGGSGGSAGEPTRTGAVMKMRAGYLGVRADYEDSTGREAAEKVAELWHVKDVASERLYNEVLNGLVEVSSAVTIDLGEQQS